MTDILKNLLIEEKEFHSSWEGRHRTSTMLDPKKRNSMHQNYPIWRQAVVHWCYSIIDHVDTDRELVYIAMTIVDRYLGSNTKLTKVAYERSVIASLLISIKLYAEDYICPGQILQMVSNKFSSREIMNTTIEIYESLSLETPIPTPARFVRTLVQLLPNHSFGPGEKSRIFDNARGQIELAVQDSFCSNIPASLVAWMAIENALEIESFDPDDLHQFRSHVFNATGLELNTGLRYRIETLRPISDVFSVILESMYSNHTPILRRIPKRKE